MDLSDDQKVITAVLAGNKDAYSTLVQRYQRPIFNLMYRVTSSYEDALDLTQETFIKAYEKLDTFRSGSRFFPWLYTIGFNHVRNFKRRDKLSHEVLYQNRGEESYLDGPACQEDEMHAKLDFQRLFQGLQKLPVDYREALILHYREGLSMEDIGAALQLSVSGAKMRVHRGLSKLRQIIFEDEDEKERIVSTGG
jgi:RNA polymerase sigma-70 factor (ECF subfamily)